MVLSSGTTFVDEVGAPVRLSGWNSTAINILVVILYLSQYKIGRVTAIILVHISFKLAQ